MKAVSIDVETTGLDPESDMTLSVAAIVFDTTENDAPIEELPTFHAIFQHPRIVGDIKALVMNEKLIRRISNSFDNDDPDVYPPEKIAELLGEFLVKNQLVPYRVRDNTPIITGAGKNFGGFDRRFIAKWFPYTGLFDYRVLDPASLYFDPLHDERLPSLSQCAIKARAKRLVNHDAVNDAQLVIEVLRYKFREDVFPIDEDEGSLLNMRTYDR